MIFSCAAERRAKATVDLAPPKNNNLFLCGGCDSADTHYFYNRSKIDRSNHENFGTR